MGGGTNTGDGRDGDRRDRERTRNGGGRGGQVGGRRGSRENKNRLWGSLRRNRGSTEEEGPIKFGTYNIRNGRNGGLEAALKGMAQANMDLGVLQETKCTDGVYTRAAAGYRVVATDAPSRHHGGIALFYKEGAEFAVE